MKKGVDKMENPIRKVADRYSITKDGEWLFIRCPITVGIKGEHEINEDRYTITVRKDNTSIILFKEITNVVIKI